MTTLYTRKDYMNEPAHLVGADPLDRANAHRRYYDQFVNGQTIAHVVARIGGSNILASTDPHFNDIPLALWDKLSHGLPLAIRFEAVGDYCTLSGLVCVAKEAARQYVERQTIKAA